MKENPAMHKIIENMKPGVISLNGFMGEDSRSIEEIIDHDAMTLEKIGLTRDEIADSLEALREKALEGFGDFISISGDYMVKADSVRGKLPCPFDHPGLFRKTVITVANKKTEEEMFYTDLGIHLIREHGFFQGKGSFFRLDPEVLLFLKDIKI